MDYSTLTGKTGKRGRQGKLISELTWRLLLQHNMPFWRISTHGDLVSLHQALELDFL